MTITLKKLFSIVSLPLALALLISCQADNNVVNQNQDIPELLPRAEKIQLGKEWDFAQNFYAKQSQTLQKNSSDVEAKLNLAQLYVKEARVTGEHGHYYPAALKMTNEILKTTEVNANTMFLALMTKAGVQLSLHEFAKARKTGREAIALNPLNAQAHGVLVDANVELGNYDKAVAIVDKMVTIKPDLRSYSRVSYLREIHGDYKGAIEALTLAVKAGYPGYEETAWAMQTLGELYMLHDEDDKAKIVFETILKERKDYPFAVSALATLEYKKGNLDTAEKITQEAMDIIPEVGFYTQMAQIYKAQNRQEEFDAIMKEIFVMLEDDVQSGHNMNLEYADIYLNLLEEPQKAIEYAMIELEKRPKNIDVNRVLAEIYVHQKDMNKAHKYIEAASATDTSHPLLTSLKEQSAYQSALSSL